VTMAKLLNTYKRGRFASNSPETFEMLRTFINVAMLQTPTHDCVPTTPDQEWKTESPICRTPSKVRMDVCLPNMET
jgi:hypothetical protein